MFMQFIKLIKNKLHDFAQTEEENITHSDCTDEEENISESSSKFSSSLYYKMYNTIFIEISENSELSENPDDILNNYYCKNFIEFCVRRYFPYLPLWSTIFLKHFDQKERVSNANIENWFNIVKNNLIKDPHQKLGRFIDALEEKTGLIYNAIQLAPHLVSRKRNQSSSRPTIIPASVLPCSQSKQQDEVEPFDINVEESWSKKVRHNSKYSGTSALSNYVVSKALEFFSNNYYDNITKHNFYLKIFKYNFTGLWETTLTNLCYSSLNGIDFLTTDLVYVAANILIQNTNDICLDPYQSYQVLQLANPLSKLSIKKNPEISICKNKRRIYIPHCENNHFVLLIVDFEKRTITSYDPLSSERLT